MSGDTGVEILWFVGAFALVLSAFAARRVPIGATLQMALAWVGIFALLFLIVWGWQLTR